MLKKQWHYKQEFPNISLKNARKLKSKENLPKSVSMIMKNWMQIFVKNNQYGKIQNKVKIGKIQQYSNFLLGYFEKMSPHYR